MTRGRGAKEVDFVARGRFFGEKRPIFTQNRPLLPKFLTVDSNSTSGFDKSDVLITFHYSAVLLIFNIRVHFKNSAAEFLKTWNDARESVQ